MLLVQPLDRLQTDITYAARQKQSLLCIRLCQQFHLLVRRISCLRTTAIDVTH